MIITSEERQGVGYLPVELRLEGLVRMESVSVHDRSIGKRPRGVHERSERHHQSPRGQIRIE